MNRNRQKSNRLIIQALHDYNEKYGDMRFHQMLHNLNITQTRVQLKDGIPTGLVEVFDQYEEESIETLKNINI